MWQQNSFQEVGRRIIRTMKVVPHGPPFRMLCLLAIFLKNTLPEVLVMAASLLMTFTVKPIHKDGLYADARLRHKLIATKIKDLFKSHAVHLLYIQVFS